MKLDRIPKPLLRFICALLFWIGATLTLVPATFVVVSTFKWSQADPALGRLTNNPPLFITYFFSLTCCGALLLWGGFLIAKDTGFAGIEGKWTTRLQESKDLLRAALKPKSDDRLNSWRVEFDAPQTEIEQRLRRLPTLPRFKGLEVFLLDGREPAVLMKGNQVRLVARAGRSSFSWAGTISTNESGNTILKGSIGSKSFGAWGLGKWLFQRVFNGFLLLMGLVLLLSGPKALPILCLLLGMYLSSQFLDRILRWTVRQEERRLETLFRDRLGAASIQLTPQVELLSLDWLKNFWKSR